MRTTTNYFVVNMAFSDLFVPACDLLRYLLFPAVTQTLGTAMCKIIPFVINTSYGVSMSSLVVITVHRFYAVAFPMRARLESRRTRIMLLFCIWLLPIALCFPHIYYHEYVGTGCYSGLGKQKFFISVIVFGVFFSALPFLFMMILYPVIIVQLIRQKAPGNSSSRPQVQRRKKRNIRLTRMFITIIVVHLLTWDTYQITYIFFFLSTSEWCTWFKIFLIVYPFPDIFHAINPVIYFIFCSSYRQGLKQIFSCCCRQSTVGRNAPGGEQIELQNVFKQ